MAIQKEFLLRYRDVGHLRFQIPARLCEQHAASVLCAQIKTISGVCRVNLYRNQQKLSIRYQESFCDFDTLIKSLWQLLSELEAQDSFTQQALTPSDRRPLLKKITRNRVSLWFNNKYVAAKETVQAAKILGKAAHNTPKGIFNLSEKAIIDFLNDILVLYLIKLHWARITQEWMLKPLRYRYEWMAVFYLFFLLVRSRKKK